MGFVKNTFTFCNSITIFTPQYSTAVNQTNYTLNIVVGYYFTPIRMIICKYSNLFQWKQNNKKPLRIWLWGRLYNRRLVFLSRSQRRLEPIHLLRGEYWLRKNRKHLIAIVKVLVRIIYVLFLAINIPLEAKWILSLHTGRQMNLRSK